MLDEPVRSKAHTRFTQMWEWNGAETIILSRATDETGYVQPTRAELMRVRGAGTDVSLQSDLWMESDVQRSRFLSRSHVIRGRRRGIAP